nr:hypothetical protein [Nocardia inohanensis]
MTTRPVPEDLLPHLRRARDLADRNFVQPQVHRAGGMSPSAYQAEFAAEGAPHIPGCYVFMHGLSDRKPLR